MILHYKASKNLREIQMIFDFYLKIPILNHCIFSNLSVNLQKQFSTTDGNQQEERSFD